MKMLVPRQYHVDVATREGTHGKTCSTDDAIIAIQLRAFERVVRDNDPGDLIGQVSKSGRC